jgi:hypothetical protein
MEERRKAKQEAYMKEHEDLLTPSTLTAAYLCPNAGTELSAIEPFTTELTDIVDLMKEQIATEARLLDGVEGPEYAPLSQNELSQPETKRGQWTNDLQTGFSTIVRIPISRPGLSTSSSTARPNSPASPLELSDEPSSHASTGSCSGKVDDSGCGIDATNECSVCTVPMISGLTPGTPSAPK